MNFCHFCLNNNNESDQMKYIIIIIEFIGKNAFVAMAIRAIIMKGWSKNADKIQILRQFEVANEHLCSALCRRFESCDAVFFAFSNFVFELSG